VRRRTWPLLLVLVVVAGALTAGTSGFSAAALDRNVSVTVSDDHREAFVPLADPGEEGPPPAWVDDASRLREEPVRSQGQRVRLFVVHNRFETPMDVDAQVVRSEVGDVDDVGSVALRPDESGVVHGDVDCGGYAGPTTVDLNVTATTGEATAHITYRVGLVCASPTPTPDSEAGEGGSEGEGKGGSEGEGRQSA
jgi:hypothetical protein